MSVLVFFDVVLKFECLSIPPNLKLAFVRHSGCSLCASGMCVRLNDCTCVSTVCASVCTCARARVRACVNVHAFVLVCAQARRQLRRRFAPQLQNACPYPSRKRTLQVPPSEVSERCCVSSVFTVRVPSQQRSRPSCTRLVRMMSRVFPRLSAPVQLNRLRRACYLNTRTCRT